MEDNTPSTSSSETTQSEESSTTTHFKLSPAELRKRLTLKCRKGEALMKQAAEEHEALEERTPEERLVLCQKLLAILSDVLDTEDWSHSPFVSKMMEPMTTMRSELQVLERNLNGGKAGMASAEAANLEEKVRVVTEDETNVFILLYQVDGSDMKKWLSQLKNLSHSIVSRPIYPTEKAARRAIQARHNVETDAYVKLTISKYLLCEQTGRKRRDRLGQPLLALTTNKVDASSVDYFVHNGMTYRMQGEKLEEINHNEGAG